jgi:CheY-like chemotaxis protein
VRVLLIEDDPFKAKRLMGFLKERFASHHIVISRSVSAGLASLFSSETPHVLLLDMSLSTFDVGPRETGGRPQNFGGIAILEHMVRRRLELPVIVITQFETFPKDNGEMGLEEVESDLKARFPAIFRGLIYYSSRETRWEERLTKTLKELGCEGRGPQ